mmetsp:Transcript_40246/g.129307  ORF Transcript_40246/g.129307 Transcript_40246/m.129307 type:complete len:388 (-) Transcript_40246:300-1463(-)
MPAKCASKLAPRTRVERSRDHPPAMAPVAAPPSSSAAPCCCPSSRGTQAKLGAKRLRKKASFRASKEEVTLTTCSPCAETRFVKASPAHEKPLRASSSMGSPSAPSMNTKPSGTIDSTILSLDQILVSARTPRHKKTAPRAPCSTTAATCSKCSCSAATNSSRLGGPGAAVESQLALVASPLSQLPSRSAAPPSTSSSSAAAAGPSSGSHSTMRDCLERCLSKAAAEDTDLKPKQAMRDCKVSPKASTTSACKNSFAPTSNHKLLDAALGTPLGFSSGPRSCLKSSPIATRNGEASPSRAWRPSESAAKPSNSLQGPCTTTARAPPRHQAVRPARGSESLARSPNCNTTRPSKSARLDSTWASSASWRSTKAVSGKSSTDARSASWS